MNEMKKNILRTSIISLMMFIISAIPVMAQTKKYSYDLVVGGSETKYVATKAGGSSFENKYYVTQDFVAQPTGSTRYFSYHSRYKGNQVSNGLKLAENDRKQLTTHTILERLLLIKVINYTVNVQETDIQPANQQ